MTYNDDMNDPEFWKDLAKVSGNDVDGIEDDSDFVDENGVVFATGSPKAMNPSGPEAGDVTEFTEVYSGDTNAEQNTKANSTKYENSLEPTIYFFTDKVSQEVVAIHMYSIFGIFTMDQSIQDWRPSSREEESVYLYINGDYDTHKYVWGSEPYSVSDPNWDPEDIQDWYPLMSKNWAKGGTVTVHDLVPYTTKLHEVFVDSEDKESDFDLALDLPPENVLEELRRFQDMLIPREAGVINSRFGLRDGIRKSYRDVADDFGVEPQRIKQVELEAIEHLRGLNLSLDLRDYLDLHF